MLIESIFKVVDIRTRYVYVKIEGNGNLDLFSRTDIYVSELLFIVCLFSVFDP